MGAETAGNPHAVGGRTNFNNSCARSSHVPQGSRSNNAAAHNYLNQASKCNSFYKSSHVSRVSQHNAAVNSGVSRKAYVFDELVSELLPLPQFQDRDHSDLRTRRSRCRHAQRLVEANQAVDALNWLGAPGMIHQGSVTAAQRSALKHVWGCVSSARPCEDPLSCYGAARELLAIGRPYDGACEAKLAS